MKAARGRIRFPFEKQLPGRLLTAIAKGRAAEALEKATAKKAR
jgi:uncharacterized protein YdhG (YjbR/CyaY superfamily)